MYRTRSLIHIHAAAEKYALRKGYGTMVKESKLLKTLRADMIINFKAKEKAKVTMLKAVIADVSTFEKNNKDAIVTDSQVLKIIKKQIKKRQESIEAFNKAGKAELVEAEAKEEQFLSSYIPEQYSEQELISFIKTAMKKIDAKGVGDFKKVILANSFFL